MGITLYTTLHNNSTLFLVFFFSNIMVGEQAGHKSWVLPKGATRTKLRECFILPSPFSLNPCSFPAKAPALALWKSREAEVSCCSSSCQRFAAMGSNVTPLFTTNKTVGAGFGHLTCVGSKKKETISHSAAVNLQMLVLQYLQP